MSKFIIANWKSNKTIVEAKNWLESVRLFDFDSDYLKVVVAPPSVFLPTARESLPASINVAAQDISSFASGSYTGAVSARNLEGLVSHVIVGHSERRRYFGETSQDVAQKAEQAIAFGITPIVCVDESEIQSQAAAIVSQILNKCIVAYEPVSAIGTGNNVPVDKVTSVSAQIRESFGSVPIIYGGSVDETNVSEYLLVCDGVLVGGASLDVDQFGKLLTSAQIQP